MTNLPDGWLPTLRFLSGATQSELAEVAGVTQNQISRYESGERVPPPHRAVLIADHLEFDVDDLFPPPGTPSPLAVLTEWMAARRENTDRRPREVRRKESYYDSQDPATYKPWIVTTDDGRVIREEVPEWFKAEMPVPEPARPPGRPRARGRVKR